MLNRLVTFFKHRWMDESDTRRIMQPEVLQRLTQHVAASELRHSGEIRVFVEASLPVSYLWRHVRTNTPLDVLAHERAVSVFGRLRVWDTEHNNGVLVYLLLAEHKIELVADRGINSVADAAAWQALVKHMGQAFAAGKFEEGLALALDEVTALLVAHFPVQPGTANQNELSDEPELG